MLKTTGQPVDKDKIGSVPHFAHQDKFEMGAKKETLLVLKKTKQKTYMNYFITWEKKMYFYDSKSRIRIHLNKVSKIEGKRLWKIVKKVRSWQRNRPNLKVRDRWESGKSGKIRKKQVSRGKIKDALKLVEVRLHKSGPRKKTKS